MTDDRDKLRDFGKPPRFDQQDPGRTLAKVLPGVSKEEAQALAKRFFELWPEARKIFEKNLERVREHVEE